MVTLKVELAVLQITTINEHCNEDGVIDTYARSLLNFCMKKELKIENGRSFDDKILVTIHTTCPWEQALSIM